MALDEKTIMNIAGQLGIQADRKKAENLAKGYENHSDADLIAEIDSIRKKLAANNISYEKQRELINGLMPMMNGKQKARLENLIRLMDK